VVSLERILHIKPVEICGRGGEGELGELELDTELGDEVATLASLLALGLWRDAIEHARRLQQLLLRE
jgi:hypothetical protein